MATLVKSVILAIVSGILVFVGTASLFSLLSLLINYYDVNMDRLVKGTCESNPCYTPASTIVGICFVLALIIASGVFVSIRRYEATGVRRVMDALRHELEEESKHTRKENHELGEEQTKT